jgi:cation:H+ antiporter
MSLLCGRAGNIAVSAEQLVKAAVGTSVGFGVSTFLLSVVFIGFDPENLGLGAVAASEGVSGIALGSVAGAAMVAMALAFGVTALWAPMRFALVPPQLLAVPPLAVLLLGGLAADGQLSRLDGTILLGGFALSLLYLRRLARRGLDIKSAGEVAERLSQERPLRRWGALGLLFLSLVAIIVGSELLVSGARTLLTHLGISDLPFGMTILAFLVSLEELARELPAARRGWPEISFGNVVGSILAFFLCNAGIIALVRPVHIAHTGADVLPSRRLRHDRGPRWCDADKTGATPGRWPVCRALHSVCHRWLVPVAWPPYGSIR